MLCVNNEAYFNRARLLRSWGRSSSLFVESEKIENRFNVEVDGIPYDAKFVFEEPGFNLEPSEMGAAFGLIQLKKLKENIDKRTEHFGRFMDFFKKYEDHFILPRQLPDSRTGWLALALTIKDSAPFQRKALQIFLEQRGIQTRTVFTGNILRQPGFKNIACVRSEMGYQNADAVMRGGMLMACHHGLEENQIQHMMTCMDEFMSQF